MVHDLYVLNIQVNFYINWMLFTIRSVNSFFMHYFKLQKFIFKQLIDDMAINHILVLTNLKIYKRVLKGSSIFLVKINNLHLL